MDLSYVKSKPGILNSVVIGTTLVGFICISESGLYKEYQPGGSHNTSLEVEGVDYILAPWSTSHQVRTTGQPHIMQ